MGWTKIANKADKKGYLGKEDDELNYQLFDFAIKLCGPKTLGTSIHKPIDYKKLDDWINKNCGKGEGLVGFIEGGNAGSIVFIASVPSFKTSSLEQKLEKKNEEISEKGDGAGFESAFSYKSKEEYFKELEEYDS